MWVYHDGGGEAAAVVVGLLARRCGVARRTADVRRSPARAWVRLARSHWRSRVPAGIAGYSVAHGLSTLAIADPRWQAVVAIIGAVAVTVRAL